MHKVYHRIERIAGSVITVKADGDTNLRVLLALAYRTHYGDQAFEKLGIACSHLDIGPDGRHVCNMHID